MVVDALKQKKINFDGRGMAGQLLPHIKSLSYGLKSEDFLVAYLGYSE